MLQKNSPGRKNIRRINAIDRLEYRKNSIKISNDDTKENKEYKTNRIKKLDSIISNTLSKVLVQDVAIGTQTKKYRGAT